MSKKADLNKGLRFVSIALTPFAFLVSPWLFLILIACQLLTYSKCAGTMENRLFLMFLCATTFTGVTVFSLKLYDILILSFFVYAAVRRDSSIYLTKEQIFYLLFVLGNYLIHFRSGSLLEVLRYVSSVILMILLQEKGVKMGRCRREILHIVVANLYYAVLVCIFIGKGWLHNYYGTVISTDVYIFSAEMRMNGFFTDPNKYMAFCFSMLILVRLFYEDGREKRIVTLLLMLSALMSGSRTALIVIAVFLIMEGINVFREKNRLSFAVWACVALLGSALWIAFPDALTAGTDKVFLLVTRFFDRTSTLESNAGITEDNRIFIWKLAGSYIVKRPLLGYGWMADQQLLPFPTHNTFLSLLLDGGIFMVGAYVTFFRRLFFGKNWRLMLPLFFLPVFVLDMSNYRMHYLMLALAGVEEGPRRHETDRRIGYDGADHFDKKVGKGLYGSYTGDSGAGKPVRKVV